ncbi:MAG: DUF4340 domain-containing protein [Thiotrichaceae bacterium]
MAKQVSSRLLLNSLLLMIAAVLIYFIWYQPKQQIKNLSASKSLFSIAAYQADAIQIQRDKKTNIVLRKNNDKWMLVEPGLAPLSADRIKHLLTILNEPVVATYDPKGKDLSQFGLAPAKIKLTISTTDQSEEATFGSTNPVTLNRYILKDNSIFTINEIVYGVLGTSVTQLLAHHVLPDHLEIVDVVAPELLAEIPTNFWQKVEAQDIADYSGDETIIGKVKLTIQDTTNNKDSNQNIDFDIFSVEPSFVIGRPDLRVKYIFDQHVLNRVP